MYLETNEELSLKIYFIEKNNYWYKKVKNGNSISSQQVEPSEIKSFLKGKNWKAGKTENGEKIIVIEG